MQFHKVYLNIKESNVIIIDQYLENDENDSEAYFIISFKKTIILIKQSSISLLEPLFSINLQTEIIFLSDIQDTFDHYIKLKLLKSNKDRILDREIIDFNQNLAILCDKSYGIHQIWKYIRSSISGFLIKQSYSKLNKQNNLDIAVKENFSESDFFTIRDIGSGSLFKVFLAYYIEKEEIFAIKVPNNDDALNLQTREINNYKQIKYPFIPKFYGTVKNKDYLIIEFINGKMLSRIEQFHLNFKEKIMIIFQLMMILNYLHSNQFVYRDLRPPNILIDNNHKVYLIDFDRMLKITETTNNEQHTVDFGPVYVAPEVNNNIVSDKNDIYSLGQIIYYIMNEKDPPKPKINEEKRLFDNYYIEQIYNLCKNESIEDRPSISELMLLFYFIFHNEININLFNYDEGVKLIIDLYELKKEYMKQNIKKVIHYYSFIADHDQTKAQYILGKVYLKKEFNEQDIEKAIRYLTLAADHYYRGFYINKAQYLVGKLYYEGEYIERDIHKAIDFLSNSTNNPKALNMLGDIYYHAKYVPQDINKAIFYYEYASKYGSVFAECTLGDIYLNGKFVERNINKAIRYYRRSADFGYSRAQFQLAKIYLSGEFVARDFDRAIQYFSKSEIRKAHFIKKNIIILLTLKKILIKLFITYYKKQNKTIQKHNISLVRSII